MGKSSDEIDDGAKSSEEGAASATAEPNVDIDKQPFNINDSPPSPDDVEDDEAQSRFDEEYDGALGINDNTK